MIDADNPIRVLIVEDDPALRRLLRQHMQQEGWQVREFATIAESRRHLRRQQVDLLVLDWQLPDGTGGQLLDVLQDRDPDLRPRVIVISGQLPDQERLARAAASRFIAKPFDIRLLLQTARYLLRAAAGSGPAQPTQDDDARLAARIQTALQRSVFRAGTTPVQVKVADGVVTLQGQVADAALQTAAAKAASRVPGVQLVINRIRVGHR